MEEIWDLKQDSQVLMNYWSTEWKNILQVLTRSSCAFTCQLQGDVCLFCLTKSKNPNILSVKSQKQRNKQI